MSYDTRNFIKQFALQNLNYFIGNLMESNCRKTTTTPQDIADCKAVRPSSIHVAEDPDGFNDSVRIAFETAGKEGWFGHYGNRPMSILVRQDGPFVTAELQTPQSFLLPNGGNVGVGCTAGTLRDIPTGDTTSLDGSGETKNGTDGGADATSRRGTDTADDVELPPDAISTDDTVQDAAADLAGDVTDTDGLVIPPDVSTDDAAQDAVADLAGDATAADGTELPPDVISADTSDVEDTVQDAGEDLAGDATVADGVELTPEDASVDASMQDAAADVAYDTSDAATPICQYFCDAGISETSDTTDAALPADGTPAADTAGPPVGVASKMCTGPAGTELLFAPANTVAAACTNDTFNSMIKGAKGCVAECGFYDNNVFLSTDPNNPVNFALNLFIPPMPPMKLYTITLALQSPVLSGGSTPALPGFMGSSFVFAFNQQFYDDTGKILWEAEDKTGGKLKGTVQILYKPQDFFFDKPEILDITYTDLIGNKMSYRYPCDTLSNPIINCTEVK